MAKNKKKKLKEVPHATITDDDGVAADLFVVADVLFDYYFDTNITPPKHELIGIGNTWSNSTQYGDGQAILFCSLTYPN